MIHISLEIRSFNFLGRKPSKSYEALLGKTLCHLLATPPPPQLTKANDIKPKPTCLKYECIMKNLNGSLPKNNSINNCLLSNKFY